MKKWQIFSGLVMCLITYSQSHNLYYKQSVFNITNTPDCNYTRNLMFEIYPVANSTYKFVDYKYLYASIQDCFDWPFCWIDKYKEQQNGFSEKTDFGTGFANGVLLHNYDIQGLGYLASVGGCSTTPIRNIASINFDYQNYYMKEIDFILSGFNNEIKYWGEFVNVPVSETRPEILSTHSNGIITDTIATLRAPKFMLANFRDDQIEWTFTSANDKFTVTGRQIDFSRKEFYCQATTVLVTVIDGYNWKSEKINIELHPIPNLVLDNTLLIKQPLCVSDQYSMVGGKADHGSIKLGDSIINRRFLVNINGFDYTLYSPLEQLDLTVENSPYNFTIIEDFGNKGKSCPQYLNNIEIKAPEPIAISSIAFTNIKCFGEMPYITLHLKGASNEYNWIYEDSIRGTILANQTQKLQLQKGSRDYQIKIEDAHHCRYDKALNFTAIEPSKLEASMQIDTAVCHAGPANVRIMANGGTVYDVQNPYRYTFGLDTLPQTSSSYSTKGGTTVYPRVMDKNNCFYSFPSLSLSNPQDYKIVVKQHVDNICPKGSSGRFLLGCNSQDPTYKYSYSLDGVLFNSDTLYRSLHAGMYTIYTMNQNACLKDTTLEIKQPPLLTITKVAMDSVRCFGDRNGSITLRVFGGTGFKKLWMDGDDHGQPQGLQPYSYDSLAAGTHWFYAEDSLACRDSVAYFIGTRSSIQHVATMVRPSCFESSDGKIDVLVSGGKAPYNHTWVGHLELGASLKQSQLPKGTYVLWSIDRLSCFKADTFVLTAPPALQVNLVGYPLLCKGQTLELDAGSDGGRYEWQGSNGFKAHTRKVTLDRSGTYWVWVKDYNNCEGGDTITLTQSDTEFKADFLMATTVVQGDTVVLLNDNIAIDSMVWNLVPATTLKLSKSHDFRAQEAVFRELGTHEVQLEGYYKGCRDVRTRKITVIPTSERNKNDQAIGIKTSVVKDCHLYPNPNDGSFVVRVDLNETGVPIGLTLSSLVTGTVLKRLDWKLYPDGKIAFQEDLHEGPYVVHVKVRDEVLALRFLVAYD